MKTNYLFPNAFKRIGWLLLLPSLLAGIVYLILGEIEGPEWNVFAFWTEELFGAQRYFVVVENVVVDEFIAIGLLLGSVFVALSKEKEEDEFIMRIRLESLVWALYWNYGVLLVAILFVYDMPFFWVMTVNMFSPLLLFVARFRWKLKPVRDEE